MSAIKQLKTVLNLFRSIGPGSVHQHRESEDRRPGSKQVAAVVVRQKRNHQQCLLVTSRDTGRWILPKGWIEDGEDAVEAVEREAWEEGGVYSKAVDGRLGTFAYIKRRPQRGDLICQVDIYQLELKQEKNRWPEMRIRKRKWVDLSDALMAIDEPDLVQVLAKSRLFKPAA